MIAINSNRRIAVSAAIFLHFLSLTGCTRSEISKSMKQSDCFSVQIELINDTIAISRIIENPAPNDNISRCLILFEQFSGDDPMEGKRDIVVVEAVLGRNYFSSNKECKFEDTDDLRFREYASKYFHECRDAFENELSKIDGAEFNFGTFFPAVYNHTDISIQYGLSLKDFTPYMSAGVIEEEDERVIPICLYNKDIVESRKLLFNNKSRHLDYLSGCLFRYIDQ